MNTYNNKRKQNTLKRIENAFLDHLKIQELSQIKVSDICKKAQINRSTFYANYVDIYDLADKLLVSLEHDVAQLLQQDVCRNYDDTDFLRLFEHIKDNQKLYHFYFKLGYDYHKELILYDLCVQDYNLDIEFLDYHIVFFKNGFNAIVKRWLDGGCKESPQQMKNILLGEYQGRLITTKQL